MSKEAAKVVPVETVSNVAQDLPAPPPAASPMPENRTRNRLVQSEINRQLSTKRCRRCTLKKWKVTGASGDTRYITCQACGATDKIVVQVVEPGDRT
jgi:hypothetical protein